MKKRYIFLRSEKGQSLVLIAAVMIGLLALAGLAIDGGNVFWQRRNTQNASDAAALAGTRQLARAICGEGAGDPEVAYAVNQFAGLNGVEDLSRVGAAYVDFDENVLGQVGAGSIPVGATGVAVKIENSLPTYFVKVIGIDTIDVSAMAIAMTGPPLAAGGMRPVGVPIELVYRLSLGDWFSLSFGNCVQHPDQCIASYTGGQIQHRGWLNLAYVWNDPNPDTPPDENPDWPRAIDPSGDAEVLQEWMRNGYSGPALYVGDYIHAKPGRNSSVIGAAPIEEGEPILVPIFDDVPHYDDIPDPKPAAASQGGGFYYHIAGFMAFVVTRVDQGGGIIEGEFVRTYWGQGQAGGGANLGFGQAHACWTHAQVINLVR